jgi:hypothetical protein
MAARRADFLATVDRLLASALALEDVRAVYQAGDQVLAAGKTGPSVHFPSPGLAEPAPRRISIVSSDRAVIVDLIERDGATAVRVTAGGAALAVWAGRPATLLFRTADLTVSLRFSAGGVAEVELALPLVVLAGGAIELGSA